MSNSYVNILHFVLGNTPEVVARKWTDDDTTIRELLAENTALKARVEKVEALWNDHHALHAQCKRTLTTLDIANLFGEPMTAVVHERDELRKVLDKMYCAMLRYQSDAETDAPPEHRTMMFEVKELLAPSHGTQEQQCNSVVSGVIVRDGCEVCSPQPKPRTANRKARGVENTPNA